MNTRDEIIKKALSERGFSDEKILNNRGLICATIEETISYVTTILKSDCAILDSVSSKTEQGEPEPKTEYIHACSQTDELYRHMFDEHDLNFSTQDLKKIIEIANRSRLMPVQVDTPIERIEKPIDKVTIERLDLVLRMCNTQLHTTLIDKIIDCVELIEGKGEDVNLKDVCKMQAEWRPIKD